MGQMDSYLLELPKEVSEHREEEKVVLQEREGLWGFRMSEVAQE